MEKKILLILFVIFVFVAWIDPFRDEVSKGNENYHGEKYEDAIKNYDKSLDYVPNDKSKSSLAFNRGDAEFKLGEYNKAVESFRESLNSGDPAVQKKAFLNMGNSYLQMKKYDEAVDSYINALKIDPDYEKAKKNLEYMLKKNDSKDKKDGDHKNKDDSDKKNNDGQNNTNKDKNNDEKKNNVKAKNKEQIRNILKSMKNKPVRRKKGNENDTRYLEKYW